MFRLWFSVNKNQAGLTIAEVLVSAFLLLLIFGLTYQMLIPAKQFWELGDTRSQVQLNARLAFEKISRDLQSSTYNSITIIGGGTPAISMLSAKNPDNGSVTVNSSGQLIWQKYIIYYLPSGDTRLFRRETTTAGLPTATPCPLTAAQLAAGCNGTGKVEAFDIISLNAAVNPSTSAIDLTISAGKSLYNKDNTSVVSGTISLEN